ncbi:hypothetical protein HDF16_005963 [Granulicella aggregans]|uniref:Uncharacterized protein n=1 Tax=Granulicella aggregans TaxID=474949 RepID=A0A7W7ZK25_9BACT|nr:hypothetical protein [Granulicella aggregans]
MRVKATARRCEVIAMNYKTLLDLLKMDEKRIGEEGMKLASVRDFRQEGVNRMRSSSGRSSYRNSVRVTFAWHARRNVITSFGSLLPGSQ